MLKVNDALPEFSGLNQDGIEIKSVQFLGKKLVIFFYPKANTPGCTAEACNLSENYLSLKNKGFEILGVSADPIKNQKKFHDKFSFPYDLIADENREICTLFGVWQLKKFMGREFMGIVRTTFLFDENGICTEVIEKVNTKNHSEQILK
ncbi:thioredoxin-dependent thiol peroxidase [Amniculibacterium sp. G2-70]|uniref:thioredoxin-dependent thiol peroxidase n=1 Tax=Amniculibacterium sp. G2-70 TaxID=2767188 RepID=UPI001653F2A1|nr:thioredoxin-dependent thiol peroxidase [Amniculibacterium sp. G2-70]